MLAVHIPGGPYCREERPWLNQIGSGWGVTSLPGIYYNKALQGTYDHPILMQLRSQIHEHTISLRFLGITLRVLRHEVTVYNVYITNQFQTAFVRGGGGGLLVEVTVKSWEDFFSNDVQEFGLRKDNEAQKLR
jgi:hypothetical protein